ncbi:PDR/VanB family oxidoreductase [Pseudonocardia sp. McavD-2-B]|uniref:PDR/VanB family oxidoreductase n=1 Tax=Pseudonocardia sp. McavD-2-B TaxID=2954499 RepID=UPI00209861AB|nr:PDR/VanB family oxidoreductase [Pseudonocardia sp. McavD-2-B]MCO7195533.1 PDR/VanB family oxidoreductase [Pseudonocardia sp. McavD-2-B]
MTEPELRLEVERKELLAEDVVLLTLRDPSGAELPEWTPGAHLDLVLTADLVRQYSLCGDPGERSVYRVAVLREPAGRGGSAHVHDVVAEGDTVLVRGPRNRFALVDAPGYVFVAGGIGITPLVPMIAAAHAAGADWQLVHGGRSRASMAFTELAGRHPDRVALVPQDEAGLLDVAGILAAAAGRPVYCCGPEGLLAAVEAEGERLGVPVHVERFSARPGALDGPDEAFEVELSGSGTVVAVPAGCSILDALEGAGIATLSSCREGTCGTCETGVLAGEPDHRDSLLTEEEQASNEVMMLCVSRSRSPRLVLEL